MLKYFRVMLALGALLAAPLGHAQEKKMSMYLEPDINGTIYFQESMSNLEKLEPRPLLDGSGAGQGWMFVQYPGQYVGYIAASDLGPGKSVRDGAKAYLRPETASPVLAVIIEGDEATVSNVSNGWATVTFVGEAPAYFRPSDNTSASVAAATPAKVSAPVAASTPVAQPAASTASEPPVLQEVKMQPSPVLPVAPPKIKPPSQSVDRFLQGRLEQVTIWDRTFGSDYKYRLVDANDDTVAYVILDESLLFGTVESYWGEQVEVKGTMKKITGTVQLEITASSLRVIR